MMNSTPGEAPQQELPPFSPIVYQPQVKYPFPFETEYSRSPTRVRAVFDELVEKTKEMNLGKHEVPIAKRRAKNLGLKVNIEQAKGLHWRSIQARHPVQLTAGPISPPRTPRRPATDYPSAEQLCLKNMADAQKKQNYAEACRWSMFAERERAISKWEAEQAAVFRLSRANPQEAIIDSGNLSPSSSARRFEAEWEQHLSPVASVRQSSRRAERNLRAVAGTSSVHRQDENPQYQTVIEMPMPLMDRSQNLRPDAMANNYPLMGLDQMQTLNIPRGNDPSLQNPRLVRSTSMQRHIPATSLRMAPTPLRPRIDHHAVSYPTPQEPRLSFIQPTTDSSPKVQTQTPPQNFTDPFGYSASSNLTGLSSSQTNLTVPSMGPATPDQTFADEYSLKKRRNEAEHFASPKIEQRKLR